MCLVSVCVWKAYMGRSELHQGYQQTKIASKSENVSVLYTEFYVP